MQHIVALQGPRVGIATRPTDAGVFGQLTDERQQTGVYGSKFCQKPVKRSQGPLMQSSTSSSLPKVPHEYHHDLRLAFEEFAAYGTGFASQVSSGGIQRTEFSRSKHGWNPLARAERDRKRTGGRGRNGDPCSLNFAWVRLQSEMNNVNFAKICQDCGLVDNRLLPKHEVDLIFAKVKQRGTRAITFKQFADLAVPLLATARRVTIEELCQAMIHARPMTFATCTRVDTGTFRRLTDENHYTGKRRLGCPLPPLPLSCFRDGRRMRGVAAGVHAEKFGRQPSKREQEPKLEAVPKDLVEGLSAAFREFCWYGASGPQQAQMGDDLSMDNARFAKLIRDAGLMQKTCLNPGAVDVVFTKSVAKGSRRINVAAFVGRALPLLALESGLPVKDIANAVGRTRPLSVATVTRTSGGLYQKLTDPSQYTGMYAERSGR